MGYYFEVNIDMFVINFMVSVGSIAFIIFVFFMMWMDAFFDNFRLIALCAMWFLLLLCIVRLIPTQILSLMPICIPFLIASFLLNNIGSSYSYSTPSCVSALWFPVNEWAVATAIASSASPLKTAFSFLIVPFMI
jgi:hypothetical protein